jgi:hypothetical protein
MHIYKEISQGNSPCNYLYLKQEKMFFFLMSSTTKIREQEGRTGPSQVEMVPVGGRDGRKRV